MEPPKTTKTSVRNQPVHVIKARLRRAGYRQLDVAMRAGLSASVVNHTIHRYERTSPGALAVWRTIEIMLGECQESTP